MKWRRWKPKSLKEALIPIQWLNWLAGLGIFEFPLGRPRPIFSMIYIACSVLGYVAIVVWKLDFIQQDLPAYERITYMLVLCMNFVVALWASLLAFFTAEKFNSIVARCTSIDSTLQAFGVDNNYDSTFKELTARIVVWCIFLNILWISDLYWYDDDPDFHKSVLTIVIMYVPLIANTIVDLTFVTLVGYIRQKLRMMNNLIRDMQIYISTSRFGRRSENCSSRVQKITVILSYDSKKSLLKHFVETMRQLHLELIGISAETNNAFGTQILLEMSTHFIVITCCLYNMYFLNTYSSESTAERNNKLLSLILWAFLCTVKVVLMNAVAGGVTNEARKTGGIVQELNGPCSDQETKDEIVLRPLYFTAYGFVSLNNNFTRTFFGTVTTYLVIVIQMSSTPNAIKSLNEVSP